MTLRLIFLKSAERNVDAPLSSFKPEILGTDLTGATSVTFNGTAATFTVVSSSEITTSVPTGASTGLVMVVTPSRGLKSNKQFRIKS